MNKNQEKDIVNATSSAVHKRSDEKNRISFLLLYQAIEKISDNSIIMGSGTTKIFHSQSGPLYASLKTNHKIRAAK